jgi:polyvinyl alcohol dehydrogenase (cytochrome)
MAAKINLCEARLKRLKTFSKLVAGLLILVPMLPLAQQSPDTTEQQGAQQPILGRPGYPPRPYNQNREGYGAGFFGDYCMQCHGNPAVERAPDPSVIKQMSPERIYAALTAGSMKEMAKDLNDDQKRGIAEYMSGRRLGSSTGGNAASMPNRCPNPPKVRASAGMPAWNGWSPDYSNARFQQAKSAGLTAKQIPELKLQWAFGLPEAMSMYAQPSFFGGQVFVGADSGYMYSVDAASGCVHWSFQAQSGIRSAATVGLVRKGSSQYAAYFGDVRGNVYAVDIANGELLWKIAVDPHPMSRIVGAPIFNNGRLYVPVTVLEEVESNSEKYPCCSGRGMVVALEAATGKQIWKTYTIEEKASIIKKTATKDVWGPSGAGVWNTPTLDLKRHAIYFGTGNGFTGVTKTSDSIFALNIDTGKILWTFQATENDIWHVGCPQGVPGMPRQGRGGRGPAVPREDCVPVVTAPDWDFSASPILVKTKNGREMLVAGQKSGAVWALDPDHGGARLWHYQPAESRGRMGILFGGAADGTAAYFNSRGGAFAVDLADGSEKWFSEFPNPSEAMKSHPGASAAVSAIPGVVFSVGLDGMIRALDSNDGKVIWDYETAHEFETVNGVKAKGGSMGSGGVAVANGMVFVTSGYVGFQNGAPGNVLLAFGAQQPKQEPAISSARESENRK